MKVLQVNSKYPPEYAGSALRGHKTYRRLKDKYGIQSEVLTSSVTHNRSETYEYEKVKVQRIANKSSINIACEPDENLVIRLLKKIIIKILFWRNYLGEAWPTYRFLKKRHRQFDLIHVFGNVNVTSTAIIFIPAGVK